MLDSTFDTLVSDFYRAATGALSWDIALGGVRTAFGAMAANMQTFEISRGQLLSLHSGGRANPEANFHYLNEFSQVDPIRQYSMTQGPSQVGRWIHCHELFDESFVQQDRYYQEFLSAYDARYHSCVALAVDDSLVTAFSIVLNRARGVLSPDEREQARRLGEHLREATIAYERVRRMAAQALAGHELLGSFPYPMCLIDQDRFISFENRAATTEIESEKRIARQGKRLMLTRSVSNLQLTERLSELYQRGHGANGVVDLRVTAADPPTWLCLSLLVPSVVLGTFGEQPQVVATLFDPHHVASLDPFALSTMFHLTPAEAKVAAHLAKGLTAEQVSQTFGTGISTVRSQISQVIAKLGVERTTDVVRILNQGEALWSLAGQARQ